MHRVLPKTFFDRPVQIVAQELLGKYLVREVHGEYIGFMITETEAYDGPEDKACHASKGRTQRTEPLFGEAGTLYIYLCYGMYWMLNVVTGPEGYPAAVLIRGVETISGPGRLTRDLHIGKELNRQKAERKTGLWFENRDISVDSVEIEVTPRIGVAYAGEWARKPWRYVLKK